MFYDRKGRAITLGEWAELFELPGYKRIAKTRLSNGLIVSTVWVGLNTGGRSLFETMLFGKDFVAGAAKWSYTTEAAALHGHKAVVAELEKELASGGLKK